MERPHIVTAPRTLRILVFFHILLTQPIALENPTTAMISIVKEEDFGTLVIPGMYLDRENMFCLQ